MIILLLRCCCRSSSSSSSSSSEENFVSRTAQKTKKGESVHFFTKTQKYAQKQNKEFKEKKRIDR
jgi:hypothetical protein